MSKHDFTVNKPKKNDWKILHKPVQTNQISKK